MTVVRKLCQQSELARVAGLLSVVTLACLGFAEVLRAEAPGVHYLNAGIMPPGAIGTMQLQRGGPLPGYFQPVEIKAPAGALISTAAYGAFEAPEGRTLLAGMMIGSVYRLRVTNIPQQEGMEVFPTIEVIDRIYPPRGQEFRFPIPIELAQEELEMAIEGKFVTRVIYLEDPESALPVAQKPGDDQSVFEAGEGESPLDVADGLGRPVAILRLGARVPDAEGPDDKFLYGSPPMLKWRAGKKAPECVAPLPLPRVETPGTQTKPAPIASGPSSRRAARTARSE